MTRLLNYLNNFNKVIVKINTFSEYSYTNFLIQLFWINITSLLIFMMSYHYTIYFLLQSSEKQMATTSTLQWNNLHLTHSKTNKDILSSLNGKVSCGQFLTIMGQSGAGKSSFLSIITGRITTNTRGFQLKGQVLMNGQRYDSVKFSKSSAYVRQDDIILGTMTVEETFQFQAKLKLHQLSDLEQQFKINQVIKKLNLQQCRKTLIGGQFSKSISGGQRKRVAIGVQLLADPSCLVLDEPTSGLDSNNSLKIMKILKKLAEDGRVIIATIHQPSTLMFQEMDRLMLLGKGKTLYIGSAKEVVPYMKSIGIKVNLHMNPADFFMLQVSEFKSSQNYKTPMTAETFEKFQLNKKQLYPEIAPQEQEMENKRAEQIVKRSQFQEANIIKQFPILFKRSMRNFFRTPSNLYGKILVLIVIPIFMAALYNNIGNQFPNTFDFEQLEKYLHDLGAFFFMFTFFNFGMNLYDTVLAFPSERQIILKETSARLYSLSTYYFCRCIIEIPISVGVCILSTTIVYFVAGLQAQLDFYLRFVIATGLLGVCGYMFGSFVGILFTTAEHAVQMLPLLVIPLVLFGGLVVNLNTIPVYSRWVQYLSPIRHSYSALVLDQMSSEKMHNIIQFEEIKYLFGVHDTFWFNVLLLTILVVSLSVGSLLTLYIKRKPI